MRPTAKVMMWVRMAVDSCGSCGHRIPCLKCGAWGTRVPGSVTWRIFELCLVHGHHVDVGLAFVVGDALFIDVGPAEAEEQTLDRDLGLAGALPKAVRLFWSQSPIVGETICAWSGEAIAHEWMGSCGG